MQDRNRPYNSGMTIPEREARTGRMLILPALFLIALLTLYPLLYTLYLSFFDVSLNGKSSFTGLDNMKSLLFDRLFWRSLGITMLYTAGTTWGRPSSGWRGPASEQALLRTPYRSGSGAPPLRGSPDIRGLLLAVLLRPGERPLHRFPGERTGLFPSRFNLMSEAPVLFIVLFSIWRNFPFTALLLLSRLQVIDRSLYDAAGVDGAGQMQKFLYITLPEILFITSALSLIRFIWNFSKFDEVYLLAPHLRTLPVHTYYTAFTGAMEMGLAASLAVIQIII